MASWVLGAMTQLEQVLVARCAEPQALAWAAVERLLEWKVQGRTHVLGTMAWTDAGRISIAL
jgi:hypothetical protein